ncbi:MAG: glutaredoxin [Gammaproteobacteria bacterium]|nr:glutaredoxin [Gammaproteobacteria bacterium]
MTSVVIYSTGTCPLCERSKALLTKWGISFEEKRVDQNRAWLVEMLQISNGSRSVPQIVVQGEWIGSFSELTMMKMDGELDSLMNSSKE